MNLLLQCCCGICSLNVIEELIAKYERLTLYFYGSNIHPESEYKKRLEVMQYVAKKYGLKLVIEPYRPDEWHEYVKGYENEPEGGKRCQKCYELRLQKAAKLAIQQKADQFSSTLSISPHKDTDDVNRAGKKVEKELLLAVTFLDQDFKKNDGFKKTIELAKMNSLYRQKYCGCIYSIKK